MNYSEWEKSVPLAIKNDVLWKVSAYRLSVLLADLGWHDATKLIKDTRTMSLSDQLYRSVGSICANIEEGYSRASARDRARFYEYALGSARESRGWYYRGREILTMPVVEHRIELLTRIIQLLLIMVPQQRSQKIKDKSNSDLKKTNTEVITDNEEGIKLFEDLPM